ncbi:MAG: MFS transporter [Thermomicrobiales bacterium]|nr:MFS transporter [Thermomicrobiales bacterium]
MRERLNRKLESHQREQSGDDVHHRRGIIAAVALGTTLAPLNSTMIAVALPSIQRNLDVSVSQTAWLVTLYLVAMAVGQPIGGRIGDLYGRRPVYLFGLLWFAGASAACAFAPSLPLLILFRTQQALAGALSFPNGAAMVREAIPAERRGSAFGAIGMTISLAAAIGPPLGGALVHAFDWQAIFWANVPIIAIAFLLNYRYLPRRHRDDRARPPFDIAGSLLFVLTLGAFIAIPTMVRADRNLAALAAMLLSAAMGVGFVLRELRIAHPVIDMRFFSQRAFAAACASIAISNLVMYTTLLALPLFMDHLRGDNEQTVGLTLMALSALAGLWGVLGGRITDERGKWLPAVAGAGVLVLGIAGLALVVSNEALWPIALALAIMGVGIGLQGAPVQTAAIEAASAARSGSAAGVFSTSRYIGSVIGATILAMVFVSDPQPGDTRTFQWLFAGLALVAVIGIAINSQVAAREAS